MERSTARLGCVAVVLVALTACGRITQVGVTTTSSSARTQAACYLPAVTTGAPQPRANAAFAFDIDTRSMVLFGGGTTQQVGGGYSDTWTWDLSGWRQQSPAQSPPATADAGMAYDQIHHYMVLYEPAWSTGATPQTWTWDGATWTQQSPEHTPPTRISPAMAPDPALGGVVLVGGTDSSDRSDVWAWNGSDWIEVHTDSGPLFGSAYSVIVSPKDGSLIVVGNTGAYRFKDATWTSLGLPWPAGTGYVGNVAYDVGYYGPVGFVRFGRQAETWTWLPGRDSGWSKLTPPCSPPARLGPAMAYDGWADLVVLFGGRYRNDTWVFNGTSWLPGAGGAAPPVTPTPKPVGAGSWSRSAGLATGRIDLTATLLQDGRVLVVGGSTESETNQLATAEIFNPKSNTWSTAAPMTYPRSRHTATLLSDGRVLVVGGLGPGRDNAEIYDPKTNSWSSAGSLVSARANHAAVLLTDGTVLVVGGRQPGRPLASAELYDPKTNSWTATGSLSVARDRPQVELLQGKNAIVTGGVSIDVGGSLDAAVLFGSPLATTEIYDPAARAWTAGPTMAVGRVGHAMAELPNGNLVVAGGTRDPAPLEILDVRSGSWLSTSVIQPRIAPVVGVVSGGRVVIAGGLVEKYDPATVASTGYTPVLLDSTEIFDTGSGTWAIGRSMEVPRWEASGVVLADGRFLVCGGGNPLDGGNDSVEAYTPA